MAKYVDGFILVVPEENVEAYRKMAEEGRDCWIEAGALEYYECRGDDLQPQDMGGERARSFAEISGATGNETVWFSFIVFESKEHRDDVNAKVLRQMEEQPEDQYPSPIPFDMKRLVYGGFQVEVEG
ncbi:MAG: DUF1428 domain-containing protein [Eubacteriales bacterium]|nr:DUF1428 domain-containing protein [Eubacteriales bacterium]MDD4324642.1 DUF1428 domain-containing protein [Eubacteriales bacterium]MDD4542004.1 DUF1428 domain-containing protein [Eubacteriales bacterium]